MQRGVACPRSTGNFLGMVKNPRKMHLIGRPQSTICKHQRTKISEEQRMVVMAKYLRHITDTNKSRASVCSHRKEDLLESDVQRTCIFVTRSIITRQIQKDSNESYSFQAGAGSCPAGPELEYSALATSCNTALRYRRQCQHFFLSRMDPKHLTVCQQ